MRYLVRKCIKVGRCAVLNKYYRSTFSDEVFSIISTELNLTGKVCEILYKYIEYIKKRRKEKENEID